MGNPDFGSRPGSSPIIPGPSPPSAHEAEGRSGLRSNGRDCPECERSCTCLPEALGACGPGPELGTDDGGTGASGSPKDGCSSTHRDMRGCDVISPRGMGAFDSLGNWIGAGDHAMNPNFACGPALFGDKSLQPKLLRVHALEEEIQALEHTCEQIARRLRAAEGDPHGHVSILEQLEAGETDGCGMCISEWVHRLISHERALQLSARSVKEACNDVFGNTSRYIQAEEVKQHYVEILAAAKRLTEERIAVARAEHCQLDHDIGEIEDFIALCFEKMADDSRETVSKQRFVEFLSGADLAGDVPLAVDPKDAELFFDHMSKGAGHIGFEQFKDEVTHGCLQHLRGTIALRRSMLKRYRDYWF